METGFVQARERRVRGLGHLPPADDMDVEVVDRLRAVFSVIDNKPVTIWQAHLLSDLRVAMSIRWKVRETHG